MNDYGHIRRPVQSCLSSRVVGPSGRCTLLFMNTTQNAAGTFQVIAEHPDDECFFVRLRVEALSRFHAHEQARTKLRAAKRDHWDIVEITKVGV